MEVVKVASLMFLNCFLLRLKRTYIREFVELKIFCNDNMWLRKDGEVVIKWSSSLKKI